MTSRDRLSHRLPSKRREDRLDIVVDAPSDHIDPIIDTLRELGEGFAFVARQVHFDVESDDSYVDLLFFHVEQLRYALIELKTGKFKPEFLGQLEFYVALVDDKLRRQHHADKLATPIGV